MSSRVVVKQFYSLNVRNSMVNVTILESYIDVTIYFYIVKVISKI